MQVTLSLFVSSDVSGSAEGQHEVRKSFVRKALVSALTGNATEYINGTTAGVGKNAKARGYAAAFAAVPQPAKVDYKGKLTQAVREQCEAKADELLAVWSAAFLEKCPLASKVKTEEAKEASKAKREAKEAAEFDTKAQAAGYIKAGEVRKLSEMTPTALADIVSELAGAGKFTLDDIKVMSAAFAPILKAADKAAKEAKAAKQAAKEEQTA